MLLSESSNFPLPLSRRAELEDGSIFALFLAAAFPSSEFVLVLSESEGGVLAEGNVDSNLVLFGDVLGFRPTARGDLSVSLPRRLEFLVGVGVAEEESGGTLEPTLPFLLCRVDL